MSYGFHALPFLGSVALGDAYFGEGVGIIYFDELDCTGTEASLGDCVHSGIAFTDCLHTEDAGVLCQGMTCQLHCVNSNGKSEIHVRSIGSTFLHEVFHAKYGLRAFCSLQSPIKCGSCYISKQLV